MIIFWKLLSSKNYNKDEEKIVGGKNGYGAKLTNIFSKYFKVETVDHIRGLKYEQEFKNNMNEYNSMKRLILSYCRIIMLIFDSVLNFKNA